MKLPVLFLVISFVAPTAYIWLLPLLARVGFANGDSANMCDSLNDNPQNRPVSISGYIQTPEATGAMAAVFFPTILLIWYEALSTETGRLPVLLFTAFFYTFLASPVHRGRILHFFSVAGFTLSLLAYFYALIGPRGDLRVIYFLALVSILLIITNSYVHLFVTDLPHNYMWITESIAFTLMVSFMPIYLLGG